MKFSIRDVLQATFVVAMAAFLWKSHSTILELKNRLYASELELQADRQLFDELQSNRVSYQASIDRFDMIASTAVQFEASFGELQAHYSEIKPVNDQTISIRSVPMLFDRKLQSRLNRTRIYVPPGRPVVLEFGVIRSSNYQRTEPAKEPLRYIANARLSKAGPYQQILSEGFHNVDWDLTTQAEERKRVFRVFLDDRLILESKWHSLHYEQSVTQSTKQQANFAKGDEVPFLVRLRPSYNEPSEGDSAEFIQVSLTDTPRDYLPFPSALEEQMR